MRAASFKRLLGAAATGPFSSFPPRHRNGLLSPRTQRVGILDEVLRHLVVLHGLTVLAIGPEWTPAACLEVASIRVVDLEVECVVGDQGEEAVSRIDTDAPEHAPSTDPSGNAPGAGAPPATLGAGGMNMAASGPRASGQRAAPVRDSPAAPRSPPGTRDSPSGPSGPTRRPWRPRGSRSGRRA